MTSTPGIVGGQIGDRAGQRLLLVEARDLDDQLDRVPLRHRAWRLRVRVHRDTAGPTSCTGADPACTIPAMNFAFTEEQDELRKTVRSFLDAKSPEIRGARADGDRGRLRPRRVDADGRADGPAGPAHPRGVRRVRVQLRRARHRARGDGAGAAVRAVLLDRRARRQRAAAVRRRGGEAGLPARHRQRRDDRHARLHRAVRQVGRVGHRDDGDGGGRRSHPDRHEDVRARRPHRRPRARRSPAPTPASACSPSRATPPG